MRKLYYRKTYMNVYLQNIEKNVLEILQHYPEYEYYIAVVKNSGYNLKIPSIYKFMENGGINYYAVFLLEEAIRLRNYSDKGILVFEPVDTQVLEFCVTYNISITIESISYLRKVLDSGIKGLKVHLKIDTGMNRFGFKNINDVKKAINMCNGKFIIEGIYTQIYHASDEELTMKQYKLFNEIVNSLDIKIPMIHVSNSESLLKYPKCECSNGVRIGDLIYGISGAENLNQYKTFDVVSHIIKIKKLEKGETIGYDSSYVAKGREYIALIPIGYSDGFRRDNKGSYVYINDKKYDIVGNVCMDITFVKVDEDVKEDDIVYVIRDPKHMEDISKHLNTVSTEVMCSMNDRVPRIEIV